MFGFLVLVGKANDVAFLWRVGLDGMDGGDGAVKCSAGVLAFLCEGKDRTCKMDTSIF